MVERGKTYPNDGEFTSVAMTPMYACGVAQSGNGRITGATRQRGQKTLQRQQTKRQTTSLEKWSKCRRWERLATIMLVGGDNNA